MKDWTVLIFMAADNDLGQQSFALRDLHEMELYGSTDKVSIVVQIDRYGDELDNGSALRGLIKKNNNWNRRTIETISPLTDIGETDTGNPDVLQDFIVWGATNYPANQYMLVIWAHGTGWRSNEIEVAVGKSAGKEIELASRNAGFGELFRSHTEGLVFKRTMEKAVDVFIKNRLLPNISDPLYDLLELMFKTNTGKNKSNNNSSALISKDIFSRAVGLDSTDMSALDSLELKIAIENATNKIHSLGRIDFKFSIIAFDACLMGGLETLYQLKDLAKIIICSEEEEPRTGWRYDLIVNRFNSNIPDINTLSAGVVDDYIKAQENYLIRLITQSAIETRHLSIVANKLNNLAGKLYEIINTQTRQIQISEKTGTRFRGDKDFLDIGHFLNILHEQINDTSILRLIEDVQISLNKTIIKSRYAFARNNQAPTGLAIYYPAIARYDSVYDKLDINSKMQDWIKFIKSYHFIQE